MTPAEVLRKADDLLSSEEKWTQGHYARNARGHEVHPISKDAVCYCLQGAIESIMGNRGWFSTSTETRPEDMLRKALHERYIGSIPGFNDHPDTKFSDIKAVIAQAIEIAKEKEA